jgi:hypothetical protein
MSKVTMKKNSLALGVFVTSGMFALMASAGANASCPSNVPVPHWSVTCHAYLGDLPDFTIQATTQGMRDQYGNQLCFGAPYYGVLPAVAHGKGGIVVGAFSCYPN